MVDLKESLKKISLFASMSHTDLAFIAERTKTLSICSQELLFSAGEKSSDVYFIFEGKLAVKYFSESGREISYTTVSSGSILGEFSAVDLLPRSATVVCEDDAILGKMKSNYFSEILVRFPVVAETVINKLVEKNRRLVNRIFEYDALTLRQRICREILRIQAQRERESGKKTRKLSNFPTHYHIATMIGSHREAVSRELSSLEKSGVITSGRRTLQIERQDLLSMLANSH
ncbi:Crp/Fnr family transcriptional regulator [Roseovarius aestuarii]|uniref:cAMP receptor protein n=1 Tax=Roseovarius aestuarii TaxID=475083 RepID=A0A1X7BWG7_9RHOB|nr:Crp/Fnr family transcriptional regulator [Roseovarius aestuarii]SMC14002.1 cAMP receptor protein [Roseovarius aestuarii]